MNGGYKDIIGIPSGHDEQFLRTGSHGPMMVISHGFLYVYQSV